MVARRKRRTGIETTGLVCAFCGRGRDVVDRLIAGPGIFICNICVGRCNEILAEESTDVLGRLDDADDGAVLASMVRLDGSRQQVAAAVDAHVRVLRARGVTWDRIGESLGMSRQSAWQRFAREV